MANSYFSPRTTAGQQDKCTFKLQPSLDIDKVNTEITHIKLNSDEVFILSYTTS